MALTRVTENTEHDANDLFEHLDITQELFEECISELEDNDLVYVKEISDCVLFVLGSKNIQLKQHMKDILKHMTIFNNRNYYAKFTRVHMP